MATFTNDTLNTTSYTNDARSDFVSGSSARLTTKAKLSVMRLSKDTEFTTVFVNDTKNETTYINDTLN